MLHELRYDRWIEDTFAFGYPPERIDEHLDVGNSLLEQVAEPSQLIGEQSFGVAGFQILAEQNHGSFRIALTNFLGGDQGPRRCGTSAAKARWPWLVGLCVPLSFSGMAVVQYWPNGAFLGVALACSILTWATSAPAPTTSWPPLPQPS